MKLPMDVYYRVLNIAESYYVLLNRLKKLASVVPQSSPRKDGQPHGNQIADPTARKAERMVEKQEECERKIRAIERALKPLGPRYKDFIRLNLFEHKDVASIDLLMTAGEKKDVRTYFLTKLAQNLNEI